MGGEFLTQENPSTINGVQPSAFGKWLKHYDFVNRHFQRSAEDRFRDIQHAANTENFTRQMLASTGIFNGVYKAPEKIDVKDGIDMFVELPSGRVVAIDLTFTQDTRRMQSKSFKFASALGTEQFPSLPWIVLPFDDKKYRDIADGKAPLPDPKETQLELINGIIAKLELKKKLRPAYDQKVLSEYLEELYGLRSKLT